ncbi:MAG: hypothetical protein R3327_05415, partial [Nitrosopumilaceae archaeon]|nr:hypothetical protein [Nitrosopumilaceae archaeon]
KPVLDIFDESVGTYGLAIVSTIFLTAVTWFMDKEELVKQINQKSLVKISPKTIMVARFVLPALTIIAIVTTFVT